MAPVSLVTIHHEGAGTPSDVPRGAAGGYTYWIGLSRWEWLREVWVSYATLNFNHVSLDICLSGNRMNCAVTDTDIQLIHGAFMDARARGYVTASPQVRPHRNSPGSSTVCPGDNTMARWNDVVLACQDSTPAPTPVPAPTTGVEPMFVSSRTQTDPNRARGAYIDLAAKHITLANAAVCNPAPVINNPNAWTAEVTGPGQFKIITVGDWDEYHFDLP